MKFAVIIPASMKSKRLPGKPLLPIGSLSMLEHVILRAMKTRASEVLVATDDDRVRIAAEYSVTRPKVVMSRKSCRNGTGRCWDALWAVSDDVELIINWQVDEPYLNPLEIDKLVEEVRSWQEEQRNHTIGTIVSTDVNDTCPHCNHGFQQRMGSSMPCPNCYGGRNLHVVKAAVNMAGRCHWFSRAPMLGALSHVGVYCYRRELLEILAGLTPADYLAGESLEQLNWIDAGYRIRAIQISAASRSINTFWDYEQAVRGVVR
jgi:3-deoxy-manno-octulosonate cytidylyltransferase (CMP-KDO synthetase)